MGIFNGNLDNYMMSNEFNIVTPAIISLNRQVFKWISDGVPGAIIYGRPRIGKTHAIVHIASVLKQKYGQGLPVYIFNSTEHIAKDKYFYTELLKAVGHKEFDKGSVGMLKERLLNKLYADASTARYKKIVLFIDEAYNFSEKDFKWLIDIYNNLYLKNIRLYVFLVGSDELLARKRALIIAKQHQIVGRFMVEECHFHGIRTTKELSICLANYDKNMEFDNRQIILTKEFFPEAFDDGKRLFQCSDTLMNEYIGIMKQTGMSVVSEIPMMYFVNTVKYCLANFGAEGKNIYFPSKAEWKKSIANSGYTVAERVYYNVKI